MTTQRNTYAESAMDRLLLVGDTIPVTIPQPPKIGDVRIPKVAAN
jgi:hypothetical protein